MNVPYGTLRIKTMATGCCGHGKRFQDKCLSCGRGYPQERKRFNWLGLLIAFGLLAGIVQMFATGARWY